MAEARPTHADRAPSDGPERGPERVHRWPVRVYFEDTDAAGIVYYANYLRFVERARTELLRELGKDNRTLWDADGVVFAIRHCAVDYRAPAKLDDLLEIESVITHIGGSSLTIRQRVLRDGAEIVRADVRLVCITRAGRPVRIPAEIRTGFQEFLASTTDTRES